MVDILFGLAGAGVTVIITDHANALSAVLVTQNLIPWCCCGAGLDSSNAARVVDILAGLAGAGVTVIITIHQPRPDVFNLMQRVMILSGDGRLVYSGQAASLLILFSKAT